jgi:hypothetical protein
MSPVSTKLDQERAELDAVLQSGIFARAPNLASFLKYVCERHFEGEADNVKEYCIAVEALNRQSDFDPKQDSIVRVEAHRLRKRLAEYYAAAGASHSIHIEIPNGQYSPKFREVRNALDLPAPVPVPAAIVPTTTQIFTPPQRALIQAPRAPLPGNRRTMYLVVSTLTFLLIFWFAEARIHRTVAASAEAREVWHGSYLDPVPGEFRFLAGYRGNPFTDRQGRVWQPDSYFDGGVSVPSPADQPIDGLPDPKFIRTRREGSFRYAIPARQGSYEVHLHFICARHGDLADPASLASFRVSVNNHPVLDAFDPISDAGGSNRLYSRVLRDVSPASDGKIHLAFDQIASPAFVNAIEVLSSEPGRVRPVRIVAAKSSVVDSDGSVWLADEHALGGVLVERHDSIQDSRLKMLFAGEHYGNFSYRIPLPPGHYRVKLYFAETFFGSKLPFAADATGARLFNVFGNGMALLHDFDVAKEAGGPNRAIVKVFENVEPNAQGNIVLEFVPLRNYAEVNAIEVAQMN